MLRRTAFLARMPVSVFLHEPSQRRTFDETLAHCGANGTDMASSLTSDFALLQSRLLKYRVVRLCDELRHVCHHPLDSMPSLLDLVKHLVSLTALFFVFRVVGRLSFRQLDEPPKEGEAVGGETHDTPLEGKSE